MTSVETNAHTWGRGRRVFEPGEGVLFNISGVFRSVLHRMVFTAFVTRYVFQSSVLLSFGLKRIVAVRLGERVGVGGLFVAGTKRRCIR